jgi:hypothetical protein
MCCLVMDNDWRGEALLPAARLQTSARFFKTTKRGDGLFLGKKQELTAAAALAQQGLHCGQIAYIVPINFNEPWI